MDNGFYLIVGGVFGFILLTALNHYREYRKGKRENAKLFR